MRNRSITDLPVLTFLPFRVCRTKVYGLGVEERRIERPVVVSMRLNCAARLVFVW